jgi:hypothetical protein
VHTARRLPDGAGPRRTTGPHRRPATRRTPPTLDKIKPPDGVHYIDPSRVPHVNHWAERNIKLRDWAENADSG